MSGRACGSGPREPAGFARFVASAELEGSVSINDHYQRDSEKPYGEYQMENDFEGLETNPVNLAATIGIMVIIKRMLFIRMRTTRVIHLHDAHVGPTFSLLRIQMPIRVPQRSCMGGGIRVHLHGVSWL